MIRMYYGNPNATPGTNGFDTFPFFDDFEAAQLDALKWKSTAPVVIDFGRLKITKGAVYSLKPAASFPGTTLEARMTWSNEANNPAPAFIVASQGQTPGVGIRYIRRSSIDGSVFDGEKFLFDKPMPAFGQSTVIAGMSVDANNIYFRNRATCRSRT